jgi:hypothetical protein
MLVLMGTGVAGSPDGYAPGIVLMNLGSLALWLVPAFMGNAWLARAKEEAGFRLHRVVEAADASSAKQQATTDSV